MGIVQLNFNPKYPMKLASGKMFLSRLPITIVLPVIMSVVLFVLTIFILVIPYMESTLMEYRRQLIHNLTEVAISTVDFYEAKHRTGELTLEQAQSQAIEHIQHLRYGGEHKDYFWINDQHPVMIMHPYRPDLDRTDISTFADPEGKHLFVEMVDVVKKNGSGFVDYRWQWKDDPLLIAPKISFVKEFTPWKWIVGTGIYINDIQMEINTLSKRLIFICLGIFLVLFALSFVVIQQAVQAKEARSLAEQQSKLQQEQLFQAAKMASVGTLVSGVAHEINNPTTSLMLNAPLLKKLWQSILPIVENHYKSRPDESVAGLSYALVKERIPQLLTHIEEGSKRIKEIVSELKDFARVTPLKHDDEVDVNLATKKAISLISNIINKKTDSFQVHYADNIPTFMGNMQKVEQVIINLIVNACQALTNKSQSINVNTLYDDKKKQAIVIVEDEGKGIPEKALPQIRDPFFTTKQNQGNTGLGLAISERIIEDHHGSMEFFSEEYKGTQVQLKFPVNQ